MEGNDVFMTDCIEYKASKLPTKFSTKEVDDSLRLVEMYNNIEDHFHRRVLRQLRPKRNYRTFSVQYAMRNEEAQGIDFNKFKLALLKEEDVRTMPKLKDHYLSKVKPDYFALKSQTDALAEEIDTKLRPKRLKTEYGRLIKADSEFDDFFQPLPKKVERPRVMVKGAKAHKTFYEFSLPISKSPNESYFHSFRGHQSALGRRMQSRQGTPLKTEVKGMRGVLKYVTVNDVL
jgi:hypothetical protein